MNESSPLVLTSLNIATQFLEKPPPPLQLKYVAINNAQSDTIHQPLHTLRPFGEYVG